jgi:hypothetical protein
MADDVNSTVIDRKNENLDMGLQLQLRAENCPAVVVLVAG